jgi:hypothetical protein
VQSQTFQRSVTFSAVSLKFADTFHVTALLVGGLWDRSPVVSLGIFSVAVDRTMCHGVDSASKNEYQDTPGGKDIWYVRVTTLPPS